MRFRSATGVLVTSVLLLSVVAGRAADVEITAKKLIVLDKLAAASRAKAVFVSVDAGIGKGSGTDVNDIAARFDVVYGSARGSFVMPTGASADGEPGWTANGDRVAKYENDSAPSGPTATRVAVVKPGRLLKLVGRGLGDVPLDVLGEGPPADVVSVSYCLENGGETICHCAEFPAGSCTWKSVAGDTGAKLTCKRGVGDGACVATTIPDLYGVWVFNQTGGSSTCTTAGVPPFETVVTLMQTGTDLTGSGAMWSYSGTVSTTEFRLNRTGIPPLQQCFFGNGVYEAFLTITGALPVVNGVVPVTQRWSLFPLIFDPQCPPCAVTRTGTMELVFVP